MTTPILISAQQARNLHLGAQGLLARPPRRARKADVLAAIERMRVLQIDTIHVVARSPYLVLFSRLGPYRSVWLDELLEEGALFECWAHEACFAPIADLAIHRDHSMHRADHWAMRHALRMRRDHAQGMDALLAHINAEGPVKASDFKRSDGASNGGWWSWKEEKRWLEALFALGELMITRREKFQRVYDISARVLAKTQDIATFAASIERAERPLAARHSDALRRELGIGAVRALGIAQARWINDYFRLGAKLKDRDLDAWVDRGDLVRVAVEGWKHEGYVHRDLAESLDRASEGRMRATHTTLLSPFDPVVWDRERASVMFDFEYRIECYTPAPKRRYGYYVLPILHRGRLIGRLDAKAHRAQRIFEVKSLYFEDGVRVDERMLHELARAISDCADWHATPTVRIGRCEPAAVRRALQKASADLREARA